MQLNGKTIILLDDDPLIVDLLSRALEQHGALVHRCLKARDFLQAMSRTKPDLLILDLNLPDGDGMDLCRQVRRDSQVPIVILSARADEVERVLGLELGADDFLGKPVFPRELVARVKNILERRSPLSVSVDQRNRVYEFQDHHLLGPTRQLVGPTRVAVTLTDAEFRVLKTLLDRPFEALDRDQLADYAPGLDYASLGRSVDNAVSRLRRLLNDNPKTPRFIQTAWGKGYRFIQEVTVRSPRRDDLNLLAASPPGPVGVLLSPGATVQSWQGVLERLPEVEVRFFAAGEDSASQENPPPLWLLCHTAGADVAPPAPPGLEHCPRVRLTGGGEEAVEAHLSWEDLTALLSSRRGVESDHE
ncbi:MAG: response regulator [Magnetococcus sp. WYHC-3]